MELQDSDLEKAVLGSIILNPENYATVKSQLKPESFGYEPHAWIFKGMSSLIEGKKEICEVTLHTWLNDQHIPDNIKDELNIWNIVEIADSVPHNGNLETYIKLVKEKSGLREAVVLMNETIKKIVTGGDVELGDVIGSINKRLSELTDESYTGQPNDLRSIATQFHERLEQLESSDSKYLGLETGYKQIDSTLAGLQAENLIVLAASPGQGKTSLATNLMLGALERTQKDILFFTLEMSRVDIYQRIITAKAKVDSNRCKSKGSLTTEDYDKLIKAQLALVKNKNGNTIIFSEQRKLSGIQSESLKVSKNGNLGLIVIDYLQIIQSELPSSTNEYNAISHICSTINSLKKELKVPILLLSQLSRESKKGQNVRPRLDHLRGSGQIEQDADSVLMLYNNPESEENLISLLINKNRNGPIGEINLKFSPQFTTFTEISPKNPEHYSEIDHGGNFGKRHEYK
jgi:replicative DNA helicase